MSRFVTSLIPTVPCGRLLRAVLLCALTLSLLAVNGLTVASAASETVSMTVMAPPPGAGHETAALPEAGAMLDLDDLSGEGRSSTVSAAVPVVAAVSLGLSHANDDSPGEIGVPLPERPPRA